MTDSEIIRVVREFIDCIEATGGVLLDEDQQVRGCVGDPAWSDLAQAYIQACKVLNRKPKTEEHDID